jgi:hypothetical protein
MPKRDPLYEGPPLFSSFVHSLLRWMENQLKDDQPSQQERQDCLHCIWFTCFAFLGIIFVYPHIFSSCLEKFFLQVFDGDDRKSMSDGCFSVLVILNFSP